MQLLCSYRTLTADAAAKSHLGAAFASLSHTPVEDNLTVSRGLDATANLWLLGRAGCGEREQSKRILLASRRREMKDLLMRLFTTLVLRTQRHFFLK